MLEASFGVLLGIVDASVAHPLDVGSDVLLETLPIFFGVVGGGNPFVGHLPQATDLDDLGILAETDSLPLFWVIHAFYDEVLLLLGGCRHSRRRGR